MSVTITQYPSNISFAGNPVLLKASTALSGKTFLKVCVELTIGLYQRASSVGSLVRKLSIPTNGGSETVIFDLSDELLSALAQIPMERSSKLTGGSPSYTGGYAQYNVKVWDEYLDEYAEVVSTEHSASVNSGTKIAIPGAYLDIQRLIKPEDTEAFLYPSKILSNKPDYEAIPAGGKIVVPILNNEYKAVDVYLDTATSGNLVGSQNLYEAEASWKAFTIPASVTQGFHSLLWNGLDVPPFFIYSVPHQPFATYFEFVNRLGAVESIYTYGRGSHKASINQERQVKKHNTSFRPSARYVKRVLQEVESIELSTGPITREWAIWFVTEFFTAEKVWMYSPEADDMIPVFIEGEDERTIFNESDAAVLDLQFTITQCINTGTASRYMQ